MSSELARLWRGFSAWFGRQPGEAAADQGMRLAVTAVVLLFPALCLLVDRSDSISLLILLAVGLATWARNRFQTGLGRREWVLVAAFAAFFLAGVIAFELGAQTDSGFRLLGRYLRLLLVLPALIALKRYRPPAGAVWAGLGLGALALGVDAVWERTLLTGFLRPNGDTNLANVFGDLAALTTFLFATGYVYVDGRLPRLGPKLMALGILLGLSACFLSGARGAWLAMPVLLILFLSARHLLHPRSVLVGAAVIVVLFLALFFLPQAHVRERLENAVSQFSTYAYVQRSLKDAPPPACIDDSRLLQAWAALSPHPGSNKLTLRVVKLKRPTARLTRNGCQQGTVLRLQNRGRLAIPVRLPRIRQAGAGGARATLMASGDGTLHFGRGPHSSARVHGRGFRRLELNSPARHSRYVTVQVHRHGIVNLVPIETFPGEYRYTLLDSSLGQRLQMWAVAWQLFTDAPATGVGTGAYMISAQHRVDAGQAPPVVAEYDHPHNEYLDALSSRGLVGLLALLALLGIPAWLFSRGLNSPDPVRMGAALGGLLVAIGFAVFGMSETMFVHSVTLGWYVIMTAVFLVTADAAEGDKA